MSTKSTRQFNPRPLARARLLRGLTNKELGQRINRSTATVWMALNGHTASPRTVLLLCAELGVSPEKVWR